jgi:hypothetical protein
MGTLFISLGLGFKLNAALYAPALYLITSQSEGIFMGTLYLMFMGVFQFLLALPFLESSSSAYIKKAFDGGRGFLLQHSFTFNFLPSDFGDNIWFKIVCLA